ncbi:hypothetical protein PGTUg99_002605, partial [Puccinia graminis f. sp. tritici]
AKNMCVLVWEHELYTLSDLRDSLLIGNSCAGQVMRKSVQICVRNPEDHRSSRPFIIRVAFYVALPFSDHAPPFQSRDSCLSGVAH